MIDKIDSVIIDSYFVVQMTQMYAVCSSSLFKIDLEHIRIDTVVKNNGWGVENRYFQTIQFDKW